MMLFDAQNLARRCESLLSSQCPHIARTARQLVIEIEQEMRATRSPGSQEIVQGATITHRPDLMTQEQRVASTGFAPMGGMVPESTGDGGALWPGEVDLRKDGGVPPATVQAPAPSRPAEQAMPGLVKR